MSCPVSYLEVCTGLIQLFLILAFGFVHNPNWIISLKTF